MIIRVVSPASRAALAQHIGAIETYTDAVERIVQKAAQRLIAIDSLDPHMAMVLKQELLALDGDALITPEVYLGTANAPTPVLAWCNERGWAALWAKLRLLPLPTAKDLSTQLEQALMPPKPRQLRLGAHTWQLGAQTLIMGIINVTPDSFSQDGLLNQGLEAINAQAQSFIAAGAHILDIGGESTRPGAVAVDAAEELRRVIPAIKAIRAWSDAPISIDTYKAEVAAAAIAAGATLINDIWGLRTPTGAPNHALAQVAAQTQTPIVLMHNRRAPATAQGGVAHFAETPYGDLLADIAADLTAAIAIARQNGIADELLILDPGLGFGKGPSQNIEVLRRLSELRSLGFPLLVGTSRKSFIGLATGAAPADRVFGTAATLTYAITQGADIVRVHDVAAAQDVCAMTDALVRPGFWEARLATEE